MVQAFRIAKGKHSGNVAEMLSGRGALLHGGRWNSPGRSVVYTSSSRALATLEVAVHLNNPAVLPAYKMLPLEIPEGLVLLISAENLPEGWGDKIVNPTSVQAWGDLWFDEGICAVMQVPSAVVSGEHNYLLNPEHEDFRHIAVGEIEDYAFDPRIKN